MRWIGFARSLAIVLAALAAGLLLASGPGVKLGWWDWRFGILLFVWSAYAAIAGIVVGIVSLLIRKVRAQWAGTLSISLIVSVAVASTVLFWAERARSVPEINDISTDTDNPPAFSALLPLRAKTPSKGSYPGKAFAEQQHQAYPNVKPLELPLPPEAAFSRARDAALDLGWDIVSADPPAGRLEATDSTFWFGFTDDIVVRITPTASGSRIDVRSASRVGRSDLGANAKRVRAFLERLVRP